MRRHSCFVVLAAALLATHSGTALSAELPPIVAIRASGVQRLGERLVQVSSAGSAVSIGGGTYVTAAHLVEGLERWAVELQIGGVWKRGRMATVEGRDAAVVTCGGDGENAVVHIATPRYGERVTVVGLKSGVAQQGIVSDTRTVSLDVECDGIQQGDSGGGVFDSDGALIGIISARNPNEPRVVYITHADAVLALIAQPPKL
jgi:S1-C subfamily serine protease